MRAIFESFIVSNESFSPKPKLLQPPPSLLYSEPFVFSSKQPTQVKCWNQADLGHFKPHLKEKAYDSDEVVSVGKNVYYRNAILFI